jgi:hypothetical protein
MVFPPSIAVTVVLDGSVIRAYEPAFVRDGRTYAPLDPFVRRCADRIWFDGRSLVVQRGGRTFTMRFAHMPHVVPLAPLVRGIGGEIAYRKGRVSVRFPRTAVVTPTPFDPAAPSSPPRVLFTSAASPTPRPSWDGIPLPRRTPLPFTEPTP